MIKIKFHKSPFLRVAKFLIPSFVKNMILSIFNTKPMRKFITSRNRSIRGTPIVFSAIPEPFLSSIYLGVWESAEIYMVNKYLKDESTIIECGSSFGIVALNLLNGNAKCHLYGCIEANTNSFNILKIQLAMYPQAVLKNYAIGYDSDAGLFRASSVLGGHIVSDSNDAHPLDSSVALKSLSVISKEINIHNLPYSLIMDVEGMEYEILLNDRKFVQEARYIICELEDLDHASVDDQITMFINIGFVLMERYDNVLAFKNNLIN